MPLLEQSYSWRIIMSHHETEDFMAWVRTICLVGITSGALMLGGI